MSDEQIQLIAQAFMKDSPEEYEGMHINQVIEELKSLSPEFLETSYKLFVLEDAH